MGPAEHDIQSILWLDGVGIHPVFYFDRIDRACVGIGSDGAVHCRYRSPAGGYESMHHSRVAADALWFPDVRGCGNVRNMVFTQGIYVPRGDTSAVVCMYGDVLVQTAE